VGIGDDARTGPITGNAVELAILVPLALDHHGSDCHAELNGAAVSKPPDRAAVGAAWRGFEFIDDLHRSNLRNSRDRSSRKGRSQKLPRRDARTQLPRHFAHSMLHGRMKLDQARLRHLDRTDFAHAAKIVSHEVHNHVQLGGVFSG